MSIEDISEDTDNMDKILDELFAEGDYVGFEDGAFEHKPFDLGIYPGFNDLTLTLDDDKLNEIEGYFGEEEKFMELSFKSPGLMWLYFVCDNIELVKKDKSLIDYLFESKEAAMLWEYKGNKVIGRCTLDIKSCIDLLDPKAIIGIYKLYRRGVGENKALKEQGIDYILGYCMSSTDYKSVRNAKDILIKIQKHDIDVMSKCIVYKVYKTSCIDNIELVEDCRQA